jgi:hypothetical protein
MAAPAMRRLTLKVNSTPNSQNGQALQIIFLKIPADVTKVTQQKLNLKAAVAREKAVQAIDGHREWKNCVVTFWVMSQWFHFLGASRGCADFRDPTAVFRLKDSTHILT